MKKIFGLLATGFLIVGGASANDVRIGTSADYPPWESVNADNEIVGFDRDFGDEVCRRIGTACVWENQAYDGLLPSLQIGRFNVVISGISITAERAEKVDFTIAYADAPNAIAVSASAKYAQVADPASLVAALAGRTIGVQTGTTHEQVVKAHFQNADLRSYDRPDQAVSDLIAGRIDAALMERSAWESFFEGDQKTKLKYLGPLLTGTDFPEFGQGQGIAMRKGQDDLRNRMNQAISEMLADGTLAKMSKEWFGYDLSAR